MYTLNIFQPVGRAESNKEIKKVNDDCNVRVGFDNEFKTVNPILSIVTGTNDWLACKEFYFKGDKCCFKNMFNTSKTLYCT